MKKRNIIVIVFLLLAVLIFFNNQFPLINFISSAVQGIFSGPRGDLYGLIVNSNEGDEIRKLRQENESLSKKITDYERLKRDNEAFRSQFELATNTNYEFIPAKIIGFLGTFSSPSSYIIDQGEKSGIKSGMAVVLKNKLIGKIGKLGEFTSQVNLTNSESFSTLAKTADGKGSGIVHGNDDFILLDRVSVNDTLSKNGIVLTVGDVNSEGVGIPPDFEIGKIMSVNRKESLPFQTAKIQSDLNFSKLEIVFIFTRLK